MDLILYAAEMRYYLYKWLKRYNILNIMFMNGIDSFPYIEDYKF